MSTTAIYCRISHDKEGEALGVARQEEDCRALCERRGWTDVEVYVDNDRGASSRSRKARPEYARMLADVRAGRVGAVVAYSNSRLTRRPAEWLELIRMAESGLVIDTVASGQHDLTTADGRGVVYRQRDREKAKELLKESLRLRRELARRFPEMKAQYRAAHPVLTSRERWAELFATVDA